MCFPEGLEDTPFTEQFLFSDEFAVVKSTLTAASVLMPQTSNSNFFGGKRHSETI